MKLILRLFAEWSIFPRRLGFMQVYDSGPVRLFPIGYWFELKIYGMLTLRVQSRRLAFYWWIRVVLLARNIHVLVRKISGATGIPN